MGEMRDGYNKIQVYWQITISVVGSITNIIVLCWLVRHKKPNFRLRFYLMTNLVYCCLVLPIQANWNYHNGTWQHGRNMCKTLGFMVMWLPISCSLQLAYGCILDYINRIYFFTQSQLISNQVQTRLRKPINQFLIDIVSPVLLLTLTGCLSMIGYNYYEILSQPIYSAMSNVRQKDYCILNFIEESDPEFNEVKTLFNDKTFQILNLTCNYFLPSTIIIACFISICLGRLIHQYHIIASAPNIILGLAYFLLQTPLVIVTLTKNATFILPFNVLSHLNYIIIPCLIFYFVITGPLK